MPTDSSEHLWHTHRGLQSARSCAYNTEEIVGSLGTITDRKMYVAGGLLQSELDTTGYLQVCSHIHILLHDFLNVLLYSSLEQLDNITDAESAVLLQCPPEFSSGESTSST